MLVRFIKKMREIDFPLRNHFFKKPSTYKCQKGVFFHKKKSTFFDFDTKMTKLLNWD